MHLRTESKPAVAMNSRERVTRAVEFSGPDRIPVRHAVLPAAFAAHGQALVDILNEFPDDFHANWTLPGPEDMPELYSRGTHTDEWGCGWRTEHPGMLGICIGHPLQDWTNWSSYKFPDIPPKQHFDELQSDLQQGHERYVFGFGTNIFERMQWLRGYQTLLCDIALRSQEAYDLRDAYVEWAVDYAQRSARTDVEAMHYSDDWGTQAALIISPDAWREFYKPAYQKMFQPAKTAGKHVHFHTDGFTWEILHDLIEVGVDVLNIQHTIMDIRAVGKEFGGKVAFRSDLDRQHILPHGSPRQVRDHVREVVDCLGSFGGGLIGHGEVGPDVPLENVRAMFEAWRE